MLDNNKTSDIICEIETEIIKRRKLFLVVSYFEGIIDAMARTVNKYNLVDVEIWQCVDKNIANESIKYVAPDKMNEIVSLYRIYDYSDKIVLLSDSLIYGSLLNYIETGLLTKQEMLNALFYKI